MRKFWSTCFNNVKKIATFLDIYVFISQLAGKFNVGWPIFFAPSHGGLTGGHVNTKTRVASPQLFAFYNEEELE
jgi:hypothetical protein